MEIYVICSVAQDGRRQLDAVDTNEEKADRKARAIAQAFAKRYGATFRGQPYAYPMNGGPNVGKVYRVRKAGEFVADVEIYSVWE